MHLDDRDAVHRHVVGHHRRNHARQGLDLGQPRGHRGASGSASASATTGSAVTCGKRASMASATWRVSDDSGRACTPMSSKRALAKGRPSTIRPAPTRITTGTAAAAPAGPGAKAPCDAAGARGENRCPNRDSSAGSSVSAAAMVASTTPMPP